MIEFHCILYSFKKIAVVYYMWGIFLLLNICWLIKHRKALFSILVRRKKWILNASDSFGGKWKLVVMYNNPEGASDVAGDMALAKCLHEDSKLLTSDSWSPGR